MGSQGDWRLARQRLERQGARRASTRDMLGGPLPVHPQWVPGAASEQTSYQLSEAGNARAQAVNSVNFVLVNFYFVVYYKIKEIIMQ